MPATLFRSFLPRRRVLLTIGLAVVVLAVSWSPLSSQNKPRPHPVPGAARPVPPPHIHPQFNPQMHQMMMLQLQQQAAVRNAFIQKQVAIQNQHQPAPATKLTTVKNEKLTTVKNQPLTKTTSPVVQNRPAKTGSLASQRRQTASMSNSALRSATCRLL